MRQRAIAALAVLAASLCAHTAAHAQFAADAPAPKLQRGGTFVEPPAVIDPEFLAPAGGEAAREGLAGRARLALRLAADVPLRAAPPLAGAALQGPRTGSPTLQAELRWTPLHNAWFAQITFFRYLHAADQRPWDPDYTYAFGYEDDRPGTFSFAYANYTGTRFSPDATLRQGRANFAEGEWTATYRFALPAALEETFLAGEGDAATCNVRAHLTPRYWDLASASLRDGRAAFSAGCRYTHPQGWFAAFDAFAYLRRSQQQPWDPDYTWAIGWAAPLDSPLAHLSLQYGNYSGNRWPGRARGPGEGRFRSGSLTVSWRTQW